MAIGWDAIDDYLCEQDPNGNPIRFDRLDSVAHEIGHTLGLKHDTLGAGDPKNLMTAGGDRFSPLYISEITPDDPQLDQLTPDQIRVARASRFGPEPHTAPLFGIALLGAWIAHRRGSWIAV